MPRSFNFGFNCPILTSVEDGINSEGLTKKLPGVSARKDPPVNPSDDIVQLASDAGTIVSEGGFISCGGVRRMKIEVHCEATWNVGCQVGSMAVNGLTR